MPNKRIDQLNQRLNPLTGDELIPIFNVNGGDTERITLNTLTSYIGSGDTYVTGGTYYNGTLTLNSQENSIIITGFTDYYTTGVTLNGTILEFDRTDIGDAYSVDLSSLKFTGNTSGECITDIFVTNVNSCSPLHIQPTNSSDVYIVENGGNVGIGTTTPNNILDVIGDVYISNSLSAATYYGDGSNLSGISGDGIQSISGGSLDDITYIENIDPLNPIMVINGVKYGNVLFVDTSNPNYPGIQNRFDKPFANVNDALSTASSLSPDQYNRTLIYVRKGNYNEYAIQLQNYTDIYCEPGVVFTDTGVWDMGLTMDTRFMGKACFYGQGFWLGGIIYRVTGTGTNALFEFDEIYVGTAAIEIGGSANLVVNGRKIHTDTLYKGFGNTIRTSGSVIFNITEKIESWHNPFNFRYYTGKTVINCPKIALINGSIYGANYKSVLNLIEGSGGDGEITINGNLVNEDTAGYWGGISGIITRWVDSQMKLTINGDLICGDLFGVYGLGSSVGSKTIINGNVISNNLVGYIASNSTVIFKNGTLINKNTTSGSANYPILSVGGNGVIYTENCMMYSGGITGSTVSAFWKDTTTSQINIYNTLYSGADTTGFFIRNTAGGQPINNVRIHNVRSSKQLDTNITDLLSPTGFIYDTNTLVPNFT